MYLFVWKKNKMKWNEKALLPLPSTPCIAFDHSYKQTQNTLFSLWFFQNYSSIQFTSISQSKSTIRMKPLLRKKGTWSCHGSWGRSFTHKWSCCFTRNRAWGSPRAQDKLHHGSPRVDALSVTQIRQIYSCKQATVRKIILNNRT